MLIDLKYSLFKKYMDKKYCEIFGKYASMIL